MIENWWDDKEYVLTKCTSLRGWIPINTLGIGGQKDPFGETYKYVVSGDSANFFTNVANSCNFIRSAIPTANTIQIKDTKTPSQTISNYAAFALLSTGKNGRKTNSGMTTAFGGNGGCSTLNSLEQENCNNDSTLKYGNYMGDGTSIVFDDIIVFVGDMQLLSELRKMSVCYSY